MTKVKIIKLCLSSKTQTLTKQKTQIATKLNSNCDITQKLKLSQNLKLLLWQNLKLILWQNSKLKLWQLKIPTNLKTPVATKQKNMNWDNTQKTLIVTNLKTSNSDHPNSDKTKQYFGKNNLTPQQPMKFILNSVLWSHNVFLKSFWDFIWKKFKKLDLPDFCVCFVLDCKFLLVPAHGLMVLTRTHGKDIDSWYFFCFGYFIHFLTTSVQGDFILPSGGDSSRYALFARFYASGCYDTIKFNFLQP